MIEVSKNQLSALMRGEAVTVGPSKRVITLKDGPFTVKHYGPGPHPGTGTPQDVHGSGHPALSEVPGEEWTSVHSLFEHIPGTARWDGVRTALGLIDQVISVDIWQVLPLKESRAKSRSGAYILDGATRLPKEFSVVLMDMYESSVEYTVVHEIGHYIDHLGLAEVSPISSNWMSETAAKLYEIWQDDPEAVIYELVQQDTNHEGRMVDEVMVKQSFQLWDAIAKSDGYKELMTYEPGVKKITVPIGYFQGDRSDPTWMLNERDYGDIKSIITIDTGFLTSLRKPKEFFARAFGQYIGTKTQNPSILTNLEEHERMVDAGMPRKQWTEQDFQPISDAFDELFRRKLWLKE